MHRALVLLLVLVAAGCDAPGTEPDPARPPSASAAEDPEKPRARVKRARCAPEVANCVAVTGRVIYVEAVDPDGDGDAHYVLAGGGVTGAGLTAVDVAPALRPRRLPRIGDLVSAAGPVFTGSFGQKQIEATVVHHQRR